MDAYKDLAGLPLEFSANGTEYDITIEEFAMHGHWEAYTAYDYNTENRYLIALPHDTGEDMNMARRNEIKERAKDQEYLKSVITNPAARWIKMADEDMSTTLLQNALGNPDDALSPPTDTPAREAPEHVQKGLVAGGPVSFKAPGSS